MEITARVENTEASVRRFSPFQRIAIGMACVLMTLDLGACATGSGLTGGRSASCIHGCLQAPPTLRKELKAGNATAELAMAKREIKIAHYADADFWFRQAAAHGDPTGEFDAGIDAEQGRGTEQNSAKAVVWFRTAAVQGYQKAQYALGLDYQYGRGVPQNLGKAIDWYRKAAAGGLATAQYALGYAFARGLGVRQNYATANAWFHRAAVQGLPAAESALGLDYSAGRGTARNPAAGNVWLRKAAAQGVAPAEYALGYNYALGYGVPRNPARGFDWFSKAARDGFAPAQAALGIDYALGHGVTKDYQRADIWLRLAAAQNVPLAEYYLGAAYYKGQGVPKSVTQANWWWKKAQASGPVPGQAQWCRHHAGGSGFAAAYNHAIQASAKHRPVGSSPPRMTRDFPQTCGFYPEISRLIGEQGTTIVRLCIGTHGQLLHPPTIVKSSGIARLDTAALRFVGATSGRWIPARQHGKAIALCVKWPVRFALHNATPAAVSNEVKK